MTGTRRKQRGAITVPLLIATVIVTLSGFGIWGFLRHWRFLAQTQLRLDRCTRAAALALKSTQQLIERSNREIRASRALLLAGTLEPPVAAAMRAALQGLVLRQDAALTQWRARQAAWLLPAHCGDWKDHRPGLPTLRWLRPPPDPIGPTPLSWESMPIRFEIRASKFPRQSIAVVVAAEEVSSENTISRFVVPEWRARWVAR